ncbi:M23 family metallopeptidase [Leifsonia sp. ZF2019]|uniref:M23 family metallopeptidase n=1 Tax=Leifsonia sp. ZF2019 TaxID=2781978 RepID=UPI001CBCE03D|nr:M23 family metallopeptidase [Leifsonia sp. ZF2019]UAJ80134.1 M23 family metallopeptidase [Leifsonia sp. ZF2019]
MRPTTDLRAGQPEPDAPLTRRAIREAREAGRRRARAVRRPAAPTAPESRPPQGKRGRGVSLVAMFAVLGIGVATSLPAMALLTEDQVRAKAIAEAFPVAGQGEVQALDRVESDRSAVVDRESPEVIAAEQLAAVRSMRIADTFTNNPRGAVQWPFPVGVPISSYFGPRAAPTAGASTNHLGVDFTPGEGVPIQIIADGVVREVVLGDNGGCGVNVTIDHMIAGALVSSKYCHMQRGSVRVQVGQVVRVADTVGKVGNTGVSTGAHLHLEIRLNGTEPVDPYAWLKANAS